MAKQTYTTEQIINKLGEAEVLISHIGTMGENGFIESFNGTLRDELLNGEIFDALPEAKIIIERWRKE